MNKYYDENVSNNMLNVVPQKPDNIRSFDLQDLIQSKYYPTKQTSVTVKKHVYIKRTN